MKDDKITRFPVTPKPRPEEVTLTLVQSYQRPCNHREKGYEIDESLRAVSCRGCGQKLNPMWVLARLAEQESLMRRSREAYLEERKALEAKRRTKCVHCGQMTRIRIS